MHGRPQPLKGKYYSSIFIHYLPVDWTLTGRDSQYNVPPVNSHIFLPPVNII
jgi:hypothetical protein